MSRAEQKEVIEIPTEYQTISGVYDKICSFEELYEAHRNARKKKRFRQDVMEFTDRLEENLIQIQNELIWETYNVGRYRQFYVREPKLRLVMALQYRDRIVQWAIYKHLNPFYDKMFIEDSYACRVGKGSHKAIERMQYWLRQVDRKPGKWYYLKLDISKYFYRVDHAILLEILGRRIKDDKLMKLLDKIVNCEETNFGLPPGVSPSECPTRDWLPDVGMPIGNLTSQLFANIYLNELDQYAKHELGIHYYIRYMDDIIILSDSKKELHQIKADIEQFLNFRLRLSLNKKTAIRPISTGLEFVGYKMWPTHTKLRKPSSRRILRCFKKVCQLYRAGELSRAQFTHTAASYSGVISHCNSKGLREKLNKIYLEERARERRPEARSTTEAPETT